MPIALQFIKDDIPGEILPLTSEGITLGRSSGHVLFEDVEISGVQCSIKFISGALVITDHGSRNGTFVNGLKIEKSKLKPSDVIMIGSYQFRVVEWPDASRFLDPDIVVDEWLESLQSEQIAAAAAKRNLLNLIDREIELCIKDAHIKLQLLARDGRTESVTLPSSDVILGRAAAIPFLLQDEEISRKHARLFVSQSGRLTLEDLNSANGTFVNEEQVHGHRVLLLNDCVRVGRTKLTASVVIPEFLRQL